MVGMARGLKASGIFSKGTMIMENSGSARPGRNDSCHCGSGKKYKKCHLAADEIEDRKRHQEEAARLAAAAPPPAETDEKGKPAPIKSGRENFHASSAARNTRGKSIFQRKVGGS
jgi:hypothetical protein